LSNRFGDRSSYSPRDNSFQDTLGESRRNADVQPMNKKITKPMDLPSKKIRTRKNRKLSHLKDDRMTKERDFKPRASYKTPVI